MVTNTTNINTANRQYHFGIYKHIYSRPIEVYCFITVTFCPASSCLFPILFNYLGQQNKVNQNHVVFPDFYFFITPLMVYVLFICLLVLLFLLFYSRPIEVYSIQPIVKHIVTDLCQVCDFLLLLPIPPLFKITAHNMTEISLNISMVWVQIPSREEQKFDSFKI
jgi:hypothetical protein